MTIALAYTTMGFGVSKFLSQCYAWRWLVKRYNNDDDPAYKTMTGCVYNMTKLTMCQWIEHHRVRPGEVVAWLIRPVPERNQVIFFLLHICPWISGIRL